MLKIELKPILLTLPLSRPRPGNPREPSSSRKNKLFQKHRVFLFFFKTTTIFFYGALEGYWFLNFLRFERNKMKIAGFEPIPSSESERR